MPVIIQIITWKHRTHC